MAHRGASHSLIAGPAVGMTAWLVGADLRDALCYSLAVMSHGPLDTLTDSERGVALMWPLTGHRFTARYQPVLVRIPGQSALQWRTWARVVMRELVVFAPAIAIALAPGRGAPYPSRWGSS